MTDILRLYPGSLKSLPIGEVYGDLDLHGREAPLSTPYVVVNMASTLDGRVSVEGKASPIGGHIDRSIMRNIRSAVDAVIVGAGTVRAEEMNLTVPEENSDRRREKGLSGQPLGVVVAGSRELPLERRVFRTQGGRVSPIVVAGWSTPEKTLEEASSLGVSVLRIGGSDVPQPRDILNVLSERLGVSVVLLEGGPTLNGAFLSQGLVDELFLTLSPKIFGSQPDVPGLSSPPITGSATSEFSLVSVHSSPKEGELYLRYSKVSSPTDAQELVPVSDK